MLAEAVNFQDGTFARLFGFQHGGADGAAPGEVLGDEEVGSAQRESFAQGTGDAGILRDGADQCDGGLDGTAADDGALEIARHGVAEAAQNFRRRVALLLGVNHIALGEDRAAAGDARGTTGGGDHLTDLFDRILHAKRLLVEEGAGAGGAFAGAIVIDDGGAFETDVLGTFAADLEDRADVRIDRADHAGDGLELVFEEQTQDAGDGAAAGAGDTDAFDAIFGDNFVEFVQQIVGGLDGATGDATVFGKDQRLTGEFGEAELRVGGAEGFEDGLVGGLADGGELETDGADVETEIDAHFGPV